jgi:hypothetical protein
VNGCTRALRRSGWASVSTTRRNAPAAVGPTRTVRQTRTYCTGIIGSRHEGMGEYRHFVSSYTAR